MSRSSAIVLFARTPEAEAASKRLRVSRTAPLFAAVAASWLRAAARIGATPIVACSAADRERLAAIAPDVARLWIEQRGHSFGDRLAGAADAAFTLGFGSVVITGIDAPPPADHVLADALATLERGDIDAAIAPARDGGINLIGLAAPAAELLRSISPRQGDVARRCAAAFERVLMLDVATDIDAAADLHAAVIETVWRDFAALIARAREGASYERETLRPSTTLRSVSAPRAPPRLS